MIDAQQYTALFKRNYDAGGMVIVNQGGTSSGKTYAIAQALFCKASETDNLVITITGQDMPNLKSGVMRDAENICNQSPLIQATIKSFNRTDRIYKFHNGSIIEFKSYGDAQDAKAGKRDYLFVNEANGVKWEIYTELALRTRKKVYIDYNPNVGFWVHDNLIGKPGVELIISDHRTNVFLDQPSRDKIEALKEQDIELWRVYARGLTGKITGLVFTNWRLCERIPAGARLLAAGLDFGFTNDQTACLLVYKQDGELWVEEVLYEKGLTNPDIGKKLKKAGISKNLEIIADSAEPKSIEELRRLGWNITGARKGPDSIANSIDILKRYKINITAESVNLRKEITRYTWKKDKSGKSLNTPVDGWNHLLDPLRYVALHKLKIRSLRPLKSRLPHIGKPSYDFAAEHLLL